MSLINEVVFTTESTTKCHSSLLSTGGRKVGQWLNLRMDPRENGGVNPGVDPQRLRPADLSTCMCLVAVFAEIWCKAKHRGRFGLESLACVRRAQR